LALDASKNGDTFVFGLQDGRIYLVNYKIDELLGEFEGYKNTYTLQSLSEHPDAYGSGAAIEIGHGASAGHKDHASKHHMHPHS
jgi:hypothetical protein